MKAKCDFCDREAKYDGQTQMGPWAYMCELHMQMFGIPIRRLYTTLDNIGKPGREPYSD